MPQYAVLFSLMTMRTTVHAVDCKCVSAARNSKQQTVAVVEAASAGKAAEMYAERGLFVERGLKEPAICKCAT